MFQLAVATTVAMATAAEDLICARLDCRMCSFRLPLALYNQKKDVTYKTWLRWNLINYDYGRVLARNRDGNVVDSHCMCLQC